MLEYTLVLVIFLRFTDCHGIGRRTETEMFGLNFVRNTSTDVALVDGTTRPLIEPDHIGSNIWVICSVITLLRHQHTLSVGVEAF
ncbi:hypothetical protein C452_07813 [Haloferax volcanii JCM 10717]|uniref:Uncharacterized protein n=1 Tax=Haloferax volcanii JCM 10717 TaxID=1227458 RepID=M0I949_HALVO|nr:hypothetical protein C452_07813 [Haloferax alexandrinus JCM 10717]RDZ33189.1 hypothetical protein DEQ67_05320 [Haloferax sp. Atlit-48N]RDZ37119.1 hypothetical protein C5B88_03240 [Haloferax sp. Atlit-24N]RLM37916.1 hypothetical protein DVK03_03240 [Haloferax sp. Atlit-109R]RLM45859.1 hypothetical protein DVK04_03255 [Haloferax sp. Atlit-105R]